jgi:uncharacterized protein YndB with AHSA1/START domain
MTSRVLVSVRVSATPSRAFEAFTTKIGSWWQPNQLFQFVPRRDGVVAFEPRLGGRFTETYADGREFEIGRIEVWEPPSRLVFSWRQASFRDGQRTQVEVRFEPAGDETRVTVQHTGWDTVPQEHVARHTFPDQVFLLRHGEWWRALLASMAQTASHP